jgi:uncharacterized membrane protein
MKQEVQCSSLPFKQQKFYGQNALIDALMVQAGHLYDRSFAIMTSHEVSMISILKCILWFCGLYFLFFPPASKSVSLCARKIEGQGCGFMCVALYKYRFRV